MTSKFSQTANWAKGINAKGQPMRDPAKDYHVAGRAGIAEQRRRDELAAAGILARIPACSMFRQRDTYAMYYLTETDPRGAMGLGGKDEGNSRRWAAI